MPVAQRTQQRRRAARLAVALGLVTFGNNNDANFFPLTARPVHGHGLPTHRNCSDFVKGFDYAHYRNKVMMSNEDSWAGHMRHSLFKMCMSGGV